MTFYVSKCPFLYVGRTLQKGVLPLFTKGFKVLGSQTENRRKGGAMCDLESLITKEKPGSFPGLTTVLTTNPAHIFPDKAFYIFRHFPFALCVDPLQQRHVFRVVLVEWNKLPGHVVHVVFRVIFTLVERHCTHPFQNIITYKSTPGIYRPGPV